MKKGLGLIIVSLFVFFSIKAEGNPQIVAVDFFSLCRIKQYSKAEEYMSAKFKNSISPKEIFKLISALDQAYGKFVTIKEVKQYVVKHDECSLIVEYDSVYIDIHMAIGTDDKIYGLSILPLEKNYKSNFVLGEKFVNALCNSKQEVVKEILSDNFRTQLEPQLNYICHRLSKDEGGLVMIKDIFPIRNGDNILFCFRTEFKKSTIDICLVFNGERVCGLIFSPYVNG